MTDLWRTTITVEVLSVGEIKFDSLAEVDYAITQGGCSGKVDVVASNPMTSWEALVACDDHGTDPDFFGIEVCCMCDERVAQWVRVVDGEPDFLCLQCNAQLQNLGLLWHLDHLSMSIEEWEGSCAGEAAKLVDND